MKKALNKMKPNAQSSNCLNVKDTVVIVLSFFQIVEKTYIYKPGNTEGMQLIMSHNKLTDYEIHM